jgi:hypothetical protein
MRCRSVIALGLLVLTAGCGSQFVPVSGRVTLDGKPLANAMVVFEPLSDDPNPGPGSTGKTDKDGRYTLTLMTGKGSGAVVGLHKVSITAYEGDTGEVPSSGSDMVFRKPLLGEEHNVNSNWKFDVPAGGSAEANFDLKSTPQ